MLLILYYYFPLKKYIVNDCLKQNRKLELEVLKLINQAILFYFVFGIFISKYIHQYILMAFFCGAISIEFITLYVKLNFLEKKTIRY